MARNERLVYDIGFHTGEDTDFYLKKGYSVIAIEANPQLVERGKRRFEKYIKSGRLNIIEGAIAPELGSGKVKFFINTKASVWGTIDGAWAARNTAQGAESVEIEVAKLDLHDVFTNFGVPFYLKIDIEGADGLVLSSLLGIEERPQYVSN